MIASAKFTAWGKESWVISCLTAGRRRGDIESSRRPRPSKQGRGAAVARDFAAKAYGYIGAPRCCRRELDQAQHGGVEGVVEIGDAFVAAVDGQRVLCQVVAADGEEIADFGERVGGQGGGRNFDHSADGRQAFELDAAPMQTAFDLHQARAYLFHLPDG